MPINQIQRIKTISQYHQLQGLPKPEHPLISLINFDNVTYTAEEPTRWVMDFYSIAMKRNFGAKIKYGQQDYDFDEGIMFFISPGQVFSIEVDKNKPYKPSGWMLLVHPDFLWNTSLAKTIKHYQYFDYAVNEALFLSPKEEATLINVLQNIAQEYHSNIDKFSQDLIIAQLELLLTYADRFYHRQFITRKISNHKILQQVEELLNNYFSSEEMMGKGLPTVQLIAEKLNVSQNYLGSLLKVLTGQSTQQHITTSSLKKQKRNYL